MQKLLGERAREREMLAIQKQQEEADRKNIKALEDQFALQKQVNEQQLAAQKIKDTIKAEAREVLDLNVFDRANEAVDFASGKLLFDGELSGREQFANDSANDLKASQMFTGTDEQVRAKEILDEIEYTKLLQEVENELNQERAAALASQQQEQKRVEDFYQKEISSLEQQAILLRDGKEAAKQFALEKQGIAAEDAKRIVEIQRQLEAQQGTDTVQPTGPNMAQESRVMVRGDVDVSPMKDTAKNTEESKKLLDQMLQELKTQSQRLTKPAEQQQIEIVGVGS